MGYILLMENLRQKLIALVLFFCMIPLFGQNYGDSIRFAALIEIEVNDDSRGMPVAYDSKGFYRTVFSYPSRTEFRFLISNYHAAHVYAFSADSYTPGTERIFPLDGVSPVLDRFDDSIAWPGEYDWIRMDDIAGTDYLVVLYSNEALNIDAIERNFAGEKGAFPERVARAVGPNLIPYGDVKYNTSMIEFSAESTDSKAILGLLLTIEHH